MGTWDTSSFGNDDAADWSWQFDEVDGLQLLNNTLQAVIDEASSDGYIEAPTHGAYRITTVITGERMKLATLPLIV